MVNPRRCVVQVVIERIVFQKFAYAALARAQIRGDLRELIDRQHGLVIEGGIVDELAYRAFAGVQRIHQAVDLGQDCVHLLDRALAGLDHVREVRALVRPQFVVVLHPWPDRMLGIDVHHGVTKHSDGVQTGLRVLAHIRGVPLADLHDDFDRCQLALRRDADVLHGADGHAFEVHRCPDLEAGRILEVRTKRHLAGKEAAGAAGHQEDQHRERE